MLQTILLLLTKFKSKMEKESLIFLRRKIANSIQDLETLYLIKQKNCKDI